MSDGGNSGAVVFVFGGVDANVNGFD